jgi:hypothetical protein
MHLVYSECGKSSHDLHEADRPKGKVLLGSQPYEDTVLNISDTIYLPSSITGVMSDVATNIHIQRVCSQSPVCCPGMGPWGSNR